MQIRIAHSPDPDDAFMFYGLSHGGVDAGPYQCSHFLEDIQTLNEKALRGEYEVTALSIHAYPYVHERYALMSCGSSMGDNYGPMLVSRAPLSLEALRGKTIAVPGKMTTAYLVLQLMLGKDAFTPRVVMFDQIPQEVADGRADAGLLIHEGQLTYRRYGLNLIVDEGVWWQQRTGLPLPLGGNGIRRDLGPAVCRDIVGLIRRSIQYSLEHRKEAVEYSLQFGRGLDVDLADKFVGMYVNAWTLDYGDRGREAVRRLMREAVEAGLVPDPGEIEFIE